MTDNLDKSAILEDRMPPFSKLLGMHFLSATADRVVAEMHVRPELCTTQSILHGGAIMAFADTIGACATVINLQPGFGTTTIESKTNFFAPGIAGKKVRVNVWHFIRESGPWHGRPASPMRMAV